MNYDVIIKNGLYFDGSNQPGQVRHVGIKDGRIDVLSLSPLDENGCPEVLDATGKWVTPGFLEIHSHYDAEVIAAPALKESVRHGVTSVTIGSCSISMVLSGAEDCSDLFTRVESEGHRRQIQDMVDAIRAAAAGGLVNANLAGASLRLAAGWMRPDNCVVQAIMDGWAIDEFHLSPARRQAAQNGNHETVRILSPDVPA